MHTVYNTTHNTCKNKSKHSEMGPVRQNPIHRTVRSVHNVCAMHCAQLLHTILHRTYLIIFPLTLQTITTAPMMSIWGKRGVVMAVLQSVSVCFVSFVTVIRPSLLYPATETISIGHSTWSHSSRRCSSEVACLEFHASGVKKVSTRIGYLQMC